jgi:hypothetical protein
MITSSPGSGSARKRAPSAAGSHPREDRLALCRSRIDIHAMLMSRTDNPSLKRGFLVDASACARGGGVKSPLQDLTGFDETRPHYSTVLSVSK